jgi:hypothetical protein
METDFKTFREKAEELRKEKDEDTWNDDRVMHDKEKAIEAEGMLKKAEEDIENAGSEKEIKEIAIETLGRIRELFDDNAHDEERVITRLNHIREDAKLWFDKLHPNR